MATRETPGVGSLGVLLLQANRIYHWVGRGGATLLVRILGLVLAALAVEMVLGAGSELLLEMRAS